MALTDTQIRSIKPDKKQRKLFDGGGLFLLVTPAGGTLWRLKYRFGGKEKLLALGTYPQTSLKEARDRRDEARRMLKDGTDPGEHRKAVKVARATDAENTFEAVARRWFELFSSSSAPQHARKVIQRLERDVFPTLGPRPVATITPPELLAVLRRIESRGAIETAHRAGQNCGHVFQFGIGEGLLAHDPSSDLRGLLKPVKGSHFAAITEPKEIGPLLRAIDEYRGYFSARYALRLAPLVFVRPGELRLATWDEIDLDGARWEIPAARMKMREPHIVPLARQAVDLLTELHTMAGGEGFLFPSPRSHAKPLSANTLLLALRAMGFGQDQMTLHGFRAMARTVLDEVLRVDPTLIDHQLAHTAMRGSSGRAYNRTARIEERRDMMQQWADYLDERRAGAEIVPIGRAAG